MSLPEPPTDKPDKKSGQKYRQKVSKLNAWKERLVQRRFWDKARTTLGKAPFSEDALAAYYCAIDPQTPRHVRIVLIGALAYFIMPIDKIPDFIPGLGFADDAAVLAAAIKSILPYIHQDHFQKARDFLNKDKPA